MVVIQSVNLRAMPSNRCHITIFQRPVSRQGQASRSGLEIKALRAAVRTLGHRHTSERMGSAKIEEQSVVRAQSAPAGSSRTISTIAKSGDSRMNAYGSHRKVR